MRSSWDFSRKLLPRLLLILLCSFESIIQKAIDDEAFPGAALVVMHREAIVYAKAFGHLTYESEIPVTLNTLFDLASLTKPLVTASAIHSLNGDGKLSLDDSLSLYFPEANPEITLRLLLEHKSGLPADIPLWFKDEYFLSLERDQQINMVWDFIFEQAAKAKPGKHLYSDLGYLLLGKIVEMVSGRPLDHFVDQDLLRTTFCPLQHGFTLDEIAPTEVDLTWRFHIVHGTVHDEKAALLGGVAGNAGLFSSALDLAALMRKHQEFELGWSKEMPKLDANGFSESAFGHLGFTGTSIWVDPDRELSIIFLTNRVHPTRSNIQIRTVRKVLAQAVLDWVDGREKSQ